MNHIQATRAKEFDRQMSHNTRAKRNMAKAYAVVCAAYADIDAPKTYRLDIDPNGAMMYVQVEYTGETGMTAKPYAVTVADIHGTVYVDEMHRFGIGIVRRVDEIIREADRA